MSDNGYCEKQRTNAGMRQEGKDTLEEYTRQLDEDLARTFPPAEERRNMRFLITYGPACNTCGERLWPRNMVILDHTYGLASCGDCIERAK